MLQACVLGALILALMVANLAFVAIEAVSAEVRVYEEQDNLRAILEEREALRILRARYARGQISAEEYRRLVYELKEGRAA